MKKEKLPSMVNIAILTLITAVFWVIYSVYQAIWSKPQVTSGAESIEPFTPTLNNQIVGDIRNAIYFTEDEIPLYEPSSVLAQPTPIPTPTTAPAIESSPSPSPTIQPETQSPTPSE